jgi:hypothetical protein
MSIDACNVGPVLAADLSLLDIDPRHWSNWWQLLVPPRVLQQPRWALAVVAGDPLRLTHLALHGVHQSAATALPSLPALTPAGLRSFADQLQVSAVIVVEHRVFTELSAQLEPKLTGSQDLAQQGLLALAALKQRIGTSIWTYPALLELVPSPAFEPVQKTFDLLISDRSAMVAYVIDSAGNNIYASAIAVKEDGDINRISTHAAIADAMAETRFAREWQRQYKRVLSLVEERFAKPSVGVFMTQAAWTRVLLGPPDQLSREMSSKSIIIDPAPAWLTGLLGGAAVASVAGRGARALASFLPAAARQRATDLANRAQQAMRDSGAHPFALLGFDPIELWSSLKQFYQPLEDDRA